MLKVFEKIIFGTAVIASALFLVGLVVSAYNPPQGSPNSGPLGVSYESSVGLGDESQQFCSGTIIDDPMPYDGIQLTVLSAKHCLSENETLDQEMFVYIHDVMGLEEVGITKIPVYLKKVSADSDLIILQTKDEIFTDLPYAKVAIQAVSFGDKVFSVSHPAGQNKVVTEGHLGVITNLYWILERYFGVHQCVFPSTSCRYQMASAESVGGSSGSGLFNSRGQLIGVLTGGNQRAPMMNYYTPLDEVQYFLKLVAFEAKNGH